MSFTLGELATQTNATLRGDGTCLIHNIADIKNAKPGDITFLFNPKYARYLDDTNATAIIINNDFVDTCKIPALITDNPRLLYAKVAAILNPVAEHKPGIAATAVIDKTANISPKATICDNVVIQKNVTVGPGCYIGPGCVLENEVKIGANTILRSNVTIAYRCIIGEHTIIHSGAVLGADGFGFVKDGDSYLKIPQVGAVIVGDNVEIGANTTIDRGAVENTVIGNGVKLDNQIQIAHSVTIGDNTVISAATAIAGSTHIGKNCLIGGCVGIIEHLEIVDNVMITGRTMVTRSISEPGSYSSSTPMDSTENWRKNSARFRRLDELAKRVAKIEKDHQKKG